jgi:hypothetical protein
MGLWREFVGNLSQPEYLHVLLNPLPSYVLGAAFVGLTAACFMRSRPARMLSLAGIILASASAWPVAYFGHAAYDRVSSMSYANAQKWLDWHAAMADRLVWLDTATAAVAAAALVLSARGGKAERWSVGLAIVASAASLAFASVVAFAGGKIRHEEFRQGPPPHASN